MLRSHQGGADRSPTPADNIQPQQGDQGEQRHQENFRNPSRGAEHQRDLLKDCFNQVGALAGQEVRKSEVKKTEGEKIPSYISPFQDHPNNPRTFI